MVEVTPNNWGGEISFANRKISYRQLAGIGGVVFWLSVMLIATGEAGVKSILGTAQFLVTLLLITFATRSVRIRTLFAMFFAGGFMMGMVAIVGRILGLTAGNLNATMGVALLEEFAVLVPPLWLLWRWRNARLWSLGSGDLILLFAFCGAGFGMVETAYILKTHSLDQLSWLPVVAWDGDRIRGYHLFNSHEIWAAFAGIGFAASWMLRSKGAWVWLFAVAGVVFGIIDHFVLDAHGTGEFIVNALGALTGGGVFVLVIFIVGLIGSAVFDRKLIKKMPMSVKDLYEKPKRRSVLNFRAWAFGHNQFENASGKDKEAVANVCLAVTDKLMAPQ